MKVACAMSGGIDSSVAALILKNDGHDVIGVTMKLWECFKAPKKQSCCSAADIIDAKRVCEQIGIPHYTIDLKDAFRKEVVEYFVGEYFNGRTPNPCIRCNEVMKFKYLHEEVQRFFGTDMIATGHYARITHPHLTPRGCDRSSPSGCKVVYEGIRLLKGNDPQKDQSYFLFRLTQKELARTIFPVGSLTKDEVRRIAKESKLKTAEKKESQEVCFIPDDDYAGFIADFYPGKIGKRGDFVDMNGKILGRHEGIHAYTIGQRRGIGFGIGERQYVVKIDAEKNQVVLGKNEDLFKGRLLISDVSWIDENNAKKYLGTGADVSVKIRYRNEGETALLKEVEKGVVEVSFSKSQRAITPGQSAVFYNGDEVLGGGRIL